MKMLSLRGVLWLRKYFLYPLKTARLSKPNTASEINTDKSIVCQCMSLLMASKASWSHIRYEELGTSTLLMLEMEYSSFSRSIPCLLMPWLLKSPEHQQTRYWLCRTDNICCCATVNFPLHGSSQIQDMIQNMIISFIIFKTIKHVKSLSWICIWIWICNWWLICFVMALSMLLNKHYISMSNITPNQASLIICNIGYYILSSWHGYRYHQWVNSLTPGRCSCNFKLLIFKPQSKTDIFNILC